jgi:hypothetical protein
MKLLLYADKDDENGKRLMAAVYEAIPYQTITIFRRLTAMQELLRTIIEPDSIAVLSAVNQAELKQMQVLREMFAEIFLILVIPDYKKSTIRLAHLLLPRFISQKEDSYSALQEVLKKIVGTPH